MLRAVVLESQTFGRHSGLKVNYQISYIVVWSRAKHPEQLAGFKVVEHLCYLCYLCYLGVGVRLDNCGAEQAFAPAIA